MEVVMSVKKIDRKESKMQYVQTARELLKYTLQQALKLPKRYTFFVTAELVRTAQEVYKKVCIIESLYSNTAEHKVKRIELCEECIGILNYFVSQLNIVTLIPGSSLESIDKWTSMITYEQALLEGLVKRNR